MTLLLLSSVATVPLATAVVEQLIVLLSVFIIAAAVGTLVAKVGRFPYTIALLLAGLAVSVIVSVFHVAPVTELFDQLQLSHDLILLVLLPALLFEGAATTDLERFRRNLVPILTLAVVGLPTAVVLLGAVGQWALDLPLLVALLFGATILPTDPVSVLALFEEVGAPDRLSVLVEGESLVNDGIGVVVFTTLLALVEQGADPGVLLDPYRAAGVVGEIAVVGLGGVVVGLAAGYAVYSVMVNLDEQMTEIVLTLILAYGSFILAEHYLHVSGVIATVVAGLFIGNQGAEYAMSPRTKLSVFNTWETAAFLVNTFIFIAIGVRTPIPRLVQYAGAIAAAIVLVILVRAAVVYPLSWGLNATQDDEISRPYQHVIVWGGLHASIPIALVLGLPQNLPGLPTQKLTAMVFGVAAFSLVVQGLTMGNLLNRLGITTRTETQELYELLIGRLRGVEAALDAAERLRDGGDIPQDVYEDFEAEYGREREDLGEAISTLFEKHPELRHEQLLMGERRVLQEEKGALQDAIREGAIASDVGERLVEEVDLKLDRIRAGETTVRESREGYEESWRSEARDFGLDADTDIDLDRTDPEEWERTEPGAEPTDRE